MNPYPRREWCSRCQRHTCIRQQVGQEHQGLGVTKDQQESVNFRVSPYSLLYIPYLCVYAALLPARWIHMAWLLESQLTITQD